MLGTATPNMLIEAQIITVTKGTLVFLNSDSLAKSVDDGDTVSYNGTYLCTGSILDPKDDVINQTNSFVGQKFSTITSGTVDSISFAYIYNRFQEEVLDVPSGNMVPVVDTLFITYFGGANLSYQGGTAGDPERFAYAAFNRTKRFPSGYNKIDTILLTSANVTPAKETDGWVAGSMSHALSTPLALNPTRANNIKKHKCWCFLNF